MVEKGGTGLKVSGIVVCVVCLVIALPALISIYGLTDDYSLLWKAVNGGFEEGSNVFLFLGRPLTSLMLIPALELAGSVANLGWLRLFSLLGLFGYLLVQDRLLIHLGWPFLPRILTGMLTISSPAAVVWMDWAICFPYAWGATAGLMGGAILVREERWGKSPLLPFASSIVLLLIALCIYQPAAAAFLVPSAVLLLQHRCKGVARRLFASLAIFIGTHLVYLVFYKLSHATPYAENPLEEKLSIGGSVLSHVISFAREILPGSLTYWGSLVPPGIMGLSIFFGVVAMVVVFLPLMGPGEGEGDSRSGYMLRLVLVVSLLGLSMASVLATEGVFYYRTRFGLYALIAVMIGEGVRRTLVLKHSWRRIAVISGTGFTMLSLFGAVVGSWHGLVAPNSAEYRNIRNAMEDLKEDRYPRALLLVYENGNPSELPSKFHEFGTTARDVSWAIEPMVDSILMEVLPDPNKLNNTVALVVPSSLDEPLCEYPVITVQETLEPERPTESHRANEGLSQNTFGSYSKLPGSRNGWLCSDDFGFLNTTYWDSDISSYVYHLELGWLMVPPGQDPGDGLNFYQSEIGWIWTSPNHYPNLYLKAYEEWAYVQADPYGPTYLLLEKTGLIQIPFRGFDEPIVEMVN